MGRANGLPSYLRAGSSNPAPFPPGALDVCAQGSRGEGVPGFWACLCRFGTLTPLGRFSHVSWPVDGRSHALSPTRIVAHTHLSPHVYIAPTLQVRCAILDVEGRSNFKWNSRSMRYSLKKKNFSPQLPPCLRSVSGYLGLHSKD